MKASTKLSLGRFLVLAAIGTILAVSVLTFALAALSTALPWERILS